MMEGNGRLDQGVCLERGSVAGIELLTRTSLNSLRDANQVSNSYLWETLNPRPTDDRHWSWSYLRHQFRLKDLEKLYMEYQHQLHKGYFTVFLIAQAFVACLHTAVLLFSATPGRRLDSIPDAVATFATLLLPLPLLALVYRKQRSLIPGILVVVILVLADVGPLFYHVIVGKYRQLRPSYSTHTLLAIYAFLPFTKNRQAVFAASLVTAVHLVVLSTITYSRSKERIQMIIAEAIYFFCVNFLGLYFRFVNEVVIRRTFLDRRACVESTLRLNYEKEQEEQLMLTILPRHIASRVRADIRNIFQQIKSEQNAPLKQKPFRELYVEEHENVSILYADVVNYSQLTVSLPPKKLVETLNELFTRFDEASEEHGVLRIKFLGDCYYCVSGVPVPDPRHASNCVNLALDMISIIQEVREERGLNVDMRIGVHSGKILSGVLGVCKWQYDVWSRDVIIANHMEQTGKPGAVHVTKQTLDLLEQCYQFELSDGASRDPLLAQYGIETFLISGKLQADCDISKDIDLGRRDSDDVSRKDFRVRRPYDPARHTMFMENNLILYQQMLRRADECMANAIQQMPIGNYRAWKGLTDVNPLCLTFEHISWEIPFLQQPDPLFKFYIMSAVTVLIAICGIQAISMTWVSGEVLYVLTGSLCTLLLLVPLTWTHSTWNRIRDPHQEMDTIPLPNLAILRALYHASVRIVWSSKIRTCLYLIVTLLIATSSLIHLIDCSKQTVYIRKNSTYYEKVDSETDCMTPWHVTEACSLAVLMCFLFLRVHFQLKLFVSCMIVVAHAYSVWSSHPYIFKIGATWNPAMAPQVAHVLSMVLLTITLHLLDRQTEYMNRLDYRWKRQLAEEQEEAATTRTVNQMLLQNILPIHVAEIYLNTSRQHEDLYHEQYNSVAVMFASLIETALDNTLDNDRSSLEILNYIICGFDKLLFEPSAQRVEKIKVAGRTYMAACGLEPGNKRGDSNNTLMVNHPEHNLVVLTRFAIHMMKVLDKYNNNNNYKFQLTVGIAHGSVSAGVVGSQKPLYDIWGDAVNMAARMDSTGVPGRIQVPESSSKILESHGVPCEFRGQTYIKGKNFMPTYFISETYKLQVSTPIMSNEHTITTKL